MNRSVMRSLAWVLAALVMLGYWAWERSSSSGHAPGRGGPVAEAPRGGTGTPRPVIRRPDRTPVGYPDFLPPEAVTTLQRIQSGDKHPYRQDGSVFQNRERQLPQQPRGYYREYTVVTPGSRDRGARRIVTGGDPPREYFYTRDHYRSFQRFTLDNGGVQ